MQENKENQEIINDKIFFFDDIEKRLKNTHFVRVKAPKNVTFGELQKRFNDRYRSVSQQLICNHSCKFDCCYKEGYCSCGFQDNDNSDNDDNDVCICNGYYCGHNEVCNTECSKTLYFTISPSAEFYATVSENSNSDVL